MNEQEMTSISECRVGRRNERKRDASQANLPVPERSPSLRSEPRHQRSHPYLPSRTPNRPPRKLIRPSSVASMSGRSLIASDASDIGDSLEMDEEMESMSLDSPPPEELEPIRPFPDKPYYWMNDYKTLEFIRTSFSPNSFYVMHNGKIVNNFEQFVHDFMGQGLVKYSFHLRVRGGKGGFGSLLRSFRVNKSTNKLMMRDLNGRRMASVDEEARLKRYLEKQARKEEEAKEKRKLKLAKLTAGPAKHQFEDQEYLSKREEIIEKTEDACEAGFALAKLRRKQERLSREQKKSEENNDSNSDADAEDVDDLFTTRGGRKRKINEPTVGEQTEKKLSEKVLELAEDDSEDDSENEPDPEELEAIRLYFEEKKKLEKEEEGECSSTAQEEQQTSEHQKEEEVEEPAKRPRLDSASNVDDLPKIDDKTPCEYGPIDLADFQSAQDLELIGLEHLKSALNDRLLKCGGSLAERAARLWSVKDKPVKEWPKNILQPELKKKLAEEEEAERKAAKKKAKKEKK